MFVLRSTFDSSIAAYNADNLRLRTELADERADKHKVVEQLAATQKSLDADRETLAQVARNLHAAISDATTRGDSAIGKELEAMRLELARERAQRELLATQLKLAQKDADWLRVLVNNAHTERAALMAQQGMSVPVATIQPFRVPMQPDPDARVGTTPRSAGIGSGLPGPLQEVLDEGLMEDMGDAAAARAGIGHDEHGALHFGPLSPTE